MAQNGSPLSGIANFGGPVDWDLGTPVDRSADKKASVSETALMKKAVMGTKAEQRTIATAVNQDNDLANDPGLDDLLNMDTLELAAKYGSEVALNRHKFAREQQDLLALKGRERNNDDVVKDAAIDTGLMAANTVGNAAALALAAFDQVSGGPALSPVVSKGLETLNEFGRGQQSELRQERAQQHALEAELNRQDREARYEARVAENADAPSYFDRVVQPYVQKQTEAFGETVLNYADDPIMAGALIPEGIGSLVPTTAAIKVASKARAIQVLTQQGMTRQAATAFLKTPGGQKLLADTSVRLAPIVVGVSEGGAGVTQTQQEILGMSEEELSASPNYLALRSQGMSHEDAQTRLARDAGAQAGLYSLPGAILAGRVSAPFAASPLKTGAGSSVTGAARNILSEAVEETLQESNSQVASNAALNTGAGLDVDLDEGVAEAGAEGFLGGIATAGPLQAPGAATGALTDTAKALGRGAAKAVEARDNQIDSGIDDASPVGTKAREEADIKAQRAGDELVNTLADTAEADQTTPNQSEANLIQETVNKALYLDEAEAAGYTQMFPELAKEDGSPITRSEAVEASGRVLKSEDLDEGTRLQVALGVIVGLNDMRAVESTNVSAAINGLAEDSPARSAYGTLTEQIRTLEASPAIQDAQKIVEDLTPEKVHQLVPVDLLTNPEASPEEKAAVGQMLDTISHINPTAVSQADYDLVLDQVGVSEILKKSLATAKRIAQEFLNADAAKEQIENDQDAVIDELPEQAQAAQRKRKHATVDTVREDILIGGNRQNALPSINEHRRRFSAAIQSGRLEEAQDALQELRNFGEHQTNKIDAYNESAAEGRGKRKPFRSYGPFGWFNDDKGVYVNTRAPSSVALAREALVDAQTAIGTYNALVEGYGDVLGSEPTVLEVPSLNEAILQASPITQNQKTETPSEPETPTDDVVAEETQSPAATDVEVVEEDTTPNQSEAVQTELETDDAETTAGEPEADEDLAEQTPPVDEAASDPEEGTAEQETGEPAGDESASDGVDGGLNTEDEVVQTEEEADTDDQSDVVEVEGSWFDRISSTLLKPAEGENYFLTSFNQRQGASSLTDRADPAAWLVENSNSLVLEDNGLENELNSDEQAAIQTLMEDTFPGFYDEFQNRLMEKATKKGWLDKIKTGANDVLGSFKEARPMNFVHENEDGSFSLDQHAAAASFMAAMEWVLQNASRGRPYLDDETISKQFGMGRFGVVSAEMRELATSGTPLQSALDAVSSKMLNLMGVSPKDDVSIWHTQGISRSMAANALEILSDAGVIDANTGKITTQDAEGKTQTRQHTTLSVSDATRELELVDQLKSLRDPFTQIFTPAREKYRYVGQAPTSIAPTQLGNKFARLSKLERQVVDRLQKMPSYVNLPMMDLIDDLGPDTFKSLLGYREVDDNLRARMNKVHLSSLEGKNVSLDRGISESAEYIAQAARDERGIENTPIYFEWRVSSVGRLQQQGPITPQGDKIMRELVSATNATIDLTNPEHDKAFWLAIAQSLDISVEKNSHADVVAEAQALLADNAGLDKAMVVMEEYVETGQMTEEMRAQFVEGMQEADGAIDLTPKAIHALLSVARYRAVAGTSDATSFKTALALEADGKTDGPVNAMVHMGTGEFTPADIERFAKGGFFFTGQPMSLSDFIDFEHKNDPSKKRAEDLYHLAAKRFTDKLTAQLKETNPAQLITLRILDALLPDFALGQPGKDGEYTPDIGRNITKNPLTVFLYGSGERGVAAKVTRQVMDEFYKVLSQVAEGIQDGTMKSWKDHPFFSGNQDLAMEMAKIMGQKELVRALQDPANAELPAQSIEALTDAVKEYFGDPMLEAVDETTGGLRENMRLTQMASQVQTAIFQDMFDKALKDAQDETDGFLSEQQMADIFAETMKAAPIYSTDAQAFHISAPQRETGETSLSESLTGKFSSRTTVMTPKDASVKVSPYLTIGTGDGRMMLNIYGNSDGSLDTSLAVFDGVEQSVDQVNSASLQINKAVYDAWMDGNPYQNIVDGYDQMLDGITPHQFEALSPGTKQVIRRALKLKKDQPLTIGALHAIRGAVQARADSAAARKAAMRQMATSADHMAGAEAPHVVDGAVAGNGNPTAYTEISDQLNQFYRAEEQKIRKARDAERDAPAVQEPTKELRDLVEAVGSQVDGHEGVYSLSGGQLLNLISRDTGASQEQAGIFRDILMKDQAFAQATYYVGSNVELEAVRDELHPDLKKQPIQLGQAHPGAGVAFVANASPETMLHEMLHFHTAGILTSHYRNPTNSEPHVRDAVRRLEALMADVSVMTPTNPNDALAVLKTELEAKKGHPAAQMSEFISYMLSNQDLIQVGKKRKVYAPLVRLLREGLQKLKELLGIQSNPGETLFSNVRFNTEVLLTTSHQTEASRQDAETDVVLEQAYPDDGRLARIERRFLDRLVAHINASRPADASRQAEVDRHRDEVVRTRQLARKASETAISQGFRMNPRQAHAFEAIHASMMSGMKLDPSLMRQANQLYGHVVKNVSSSDFLDAIGAGDNPDSATLSEAASKADFLVGTTGIRQTAEGRTDLLATFMALALVDNDLRAVMETLTPPKTLEVKQDSFDGFLNSLANSVVNLLTRMSFSRPTQARTVTRELDRLADGLSEIQGERRLLAASKLTEPLDKANDFVADQLSSATKKTVDFLTERRERTNNTYLRGALSAAELVTSFGSQSEGAAAGESLTTMLNHTPGLATLREMISDLRGMTASNADLIRLINPVKAQVDALRQDYREGIPEELSKRFSRKLSREEWSRMFMALGRADLLSLGRRGAIDVMRSPSQLNNRISELEERVAQLGGKFAPRYLEKAQALAVYMVDRKVTTNNLLRNSHAIAHLFGEQGTSKNTIAKQVTPDLVQAIGNLTSLYAYARLDDVTKDTLKELMETEADGMQAVAGFHHSTRAMELERRDRHGKVNQVAQNNGWKGYVPSIAQEGSSIIVADDSKFDELTRKGYVRVGTYHGDANEDFGGKRGYYQSTVAGRNAFRQGVAQTVHESWQGVDARTGQSRAGETAGLLLGNKVNRLAQRINAAGSRNSLPAGEYLMPVFNADGDVVAYERPMDPDKTQGHQRDTHLGRMLGVWAGRILEENAAEDFNTELVQTLKKIYDDQKDGREDEFVNIADPKIKDPVIRDAWDTLGFKIKQDAAEIFGQDNFVPVRRDMVNDAIGYRAAAVTDPWTGISRWSPEAQKVVRDTATRILGKDAFKRLSQGQTLINDAVSYAKTSIIVRSMVVAFDNILSNLFHLGVRGIDPLTAAKGLRQKFVEITEYVKNREEIQKLELDLAAAYDDPAARAKAKARILALEDANAKLTIKPLIDAGEFSTISENLTEADVAIREGRWADFMETATDKLPGWAGTVAKNVMITKDTALFQGLNRMVQYGDFVAKAVLYDHLTEKKGMDHSVAIDEITEEFVQYNRLPGRGRDFLESNGLLWFWNYKLRIQKIAVKMMRERPLNSLFLVGGVGPATGIDTVMSGSLAGAVLDDRIGYSIGPEMGFNAPTLNPWYNMVN